MIVKLRLCNGKAPGADWLVWKASFVIGRHEGCDLRVTSTRVSVHHCCLVRRDNEIWVKDLDSTNGTYVNGERIDGERRLGLGDHIQVGPAVFEVLQEASGGLRLDDKGEYAKTLPGVHIHPAPAADPADDA